MKSEAGRLRHTFKREYVPESPASFLEAHKVLMAEAFGWAFSITGTYNLNMARGEFVHEVLPPAEARTPGRRMLAVTAQFYSFDSQDIIDNKQTELRRMISAQRVGAEAYEATRSDTGASTGVLK